MESFVANLLATWDSTSSIVLATAGATGIVSGPPTGLSATVLDPSSSQASSLYFRRYEPSIASFFAVAAIVATFARLGTTAQWDLPHLIGTPVFPTVASVAAFLGGLGLSILHYRLLSSSHPLHDIPGPLLARASKWWLLYKVLGYGVGGVYVDFKKCFLISLF